MSPDLSGSFSAQKTLRAWCLLALLLCASAALLALAHSAEAATTLLKPNLGLVGYWSFDEGTSTKATDFSGFGNTGTLNGSPSWVNGKLGKALDFELSNSDFVDVGSGSSLQQTSAMTVCAWVRVETIDATDDGHFAARATSGDTPVWPYAFYATECGSGNYFFGSVGQTTVAPWKITRPRAA